MDPPASRPSSSSGPQGQQAQQQQQQGVNTAEATGSTTPLPRNPALPESQAENQTDEAQQQQKEQQAREKEKEEEKDRERRRLLERQKEKSEHKPKLVISSDELNVLIYSVSPLVSELGWVSALERSEVLRKGRGGAKQGSKKRGCGCGS